MRGHKVYRIVNKPATVLGLDWRYFIAALSLSFVTTSWMHSKLMLLAGAVFYGAIAAWISAKDPALPFVYLRRWTMKNSFDPGKR